MSKNPKTHPKYFNRIANECRSLYKDLTLQYGKSGIANIVDFVEDSEQGLGMELYPMQKFILKVFFQIPLSDDLEDNAIEIPDMFNEKVLTVMTEVGAFKYLYHENKINLSYEDWRDHDIKFVEILLFIGRRGTKTTTVSMVYCYIVYLLLKIQNPHKYFKIATTDPIGLLVVSNSEDGAIRQYDSIKQMLANSKAISPHMVGNVGNEYYIASPQHTFLKEQGVKVSMRGDIKLIASTASSKVRGASTVAVGMDEYAHFRDSGVKNKAKQIDKEIYEALLPAVSGFITPKGETFGKSFVFTSPNGKKGEAWVKFKSSFTSKDVLMINLPSHWVNRNLSSIFIKKMWNESEASCRQEYFGEFLDQIGGFITNIHRLKSQVNMLWSNTIKNSVEGAEYMLSVDMAQSGDGLVFAVTHKEKRRPKHLPPTVDVDYKGLEYKEYVAKKDCIVLDFYVTLEPEEEGGVISHEIILSLFKKIVGNYNIVKATIDQWNYQVYSELLINNNILKEEILELFLATKDSNSLVAKTFKRVYTEGRLMLPRTFITDGTYENFIGLVEETKGKGIISVYAVGSLAHDDDYSAISRAVLMAEVSVAQEVIVGSSMLQPNRAESTLEKNQGEDVKSYLEEVRRIKGKSVKIAQWKMPKNQENKG